MKTKFMSLGKEMAYDDFILNSINVVHIVCITNTVLWWDVTINQWEAFIVWFLEIFFSLSLYDCIFVAMDIQGYKNHFTLSLQFSTHMCIWEIYIEIPLKLYKWGNWGSGLSCPNLHFITIYARVQHCLSFSLYILYKCACPSIDSCICKKTASSGYISLPSHLNLIAIIYVFLVH